MADPEITDLELLHTLKIKGRATVDEVAAVSGGDAEAVQSALEKLAEQDLVTERTGGRRPGWMLTSTGRGKHEEMLRKGLGGDDLEKLDEHYSGFLAENETVKEIASEWQAASDDGARFELLERLNEAHPRAEEKLRLSAEITPRYARYADRLTRALERLEDDHRYLVGTTVDSYHSVWFEAHEDYLLTLGRTREEEGSV